MTERNASDAVRSRKLSRSIDEDALRHPLETRIFVLSVILNVALLILAVVLATNASDWLETHPTIAKHLDQIRALASGLVLGPFALTFLRNARRSYVRGKSVALSREQMPELYQLLDRHCAQIGLDPPPGMFLSQGGISGYST